ncbi:hypothetical protein [Nocardia carnea]|uniref:hypothetical protein n=1 Tax=Nocardia carnea TaxID=37328 RepID=UPI002458FEDF|nr:hypothetical protein [Nocardia carnea]
MQSLAESFAAIEAEENESRAAHLAEIERYSIPGPPPPAPTREAAISRLIQAGTAERADIEDGRHNDGSEVHAAYAIAERAGLSLEEANAAYSHGVSWGETPYPLPTEAGAW